MFIPFYFSYRHFLPKWAFGKIIDLSLKQLFTWSGHNIAEEQKVNLYQHLFSFCSVKTIVVCVNFIVHMHIECQCSHFVALVSNHACGSIPDVRRHGKLGFQQLAAAGRGPSRLSNLPYQSADRSYIRREGHCQ